MPGQAGATPIVWGERVFVTSADGDNLILICLNAKTGKELWRQLLRAEIRMLEPVKAIQHPHRLLPMERMCGSFFSTGVLACYDMDGKQIWKLDCNERFGKIDIQFGLTSTPVLDGDSLYLQLLHGPMVRGNKDRTGKVIKLNKSNGETIWQVDRITEADFECKHSYSSPLMINDGQRKLLVVHGADCTTGHDITSGREVWAPCRSEWTYQDQSEEQRCNLSVCLLAWPLVRGH